MRFAFAIAFTTTFLLIGCSKDAVITPTTVTTKLTAIPEGFPAIEYPSDNGFTLSRWRLGKKLFYDNRLSIDSTVSCASCHKSNLAFSDNVAKTSGVFGRPGSRNAPSLTNVAYQPYYTREGGIGSLEAQVLVPIQEHNEFGFNIVDITKRLASDSVYQNMSRKAYNRNLDYFVLVRAIANFERTIISGNSAYDQFKYSGVQSAITGFERKGMELFYSDKTHCSSCHSGFNFTNYAFENNGLYQTYSDVGRKRLTGEASDLGKFKVPTLRNIAITAPYMHDGSLQTLEDVVEHYNGGGTLHPNKSDLIHALNLTYIEKQQLIAFLHTLTDHDFLNNNQFKNE